MVEQPVFLRIDRIIDEAEGVRSFIFSHPLDAFPGQFIMLWIPRLDQKPFGVSYHSEREFGITVQKVGRFTEQLFGYKVGDKVGIQGPYGRPFDTRGETIALVGGGFGSAPLAYQFDVLKALGKKVFFIIGSRTGSCLLYGERFRDGIVHCTDDGSCGRKGYATDALKELIDKERIDMVYSCGPEKMMQGAIAICDEKGIDCQVSMERYMKCGFGVCGQCCCDPSGVRICIDGPVFDKEEAKKLTEFGKYKRDGTGASHPL